MAKKKDRVNQKKDEEKLLLAYKILCEFSEHDIPVIRFNCRKAKNELWQALFELDLIPQKQGREAHLLEPATVLLQGRKPGKKLSQFSG